MRTLYPEITPFDQGTLQVDDRHTLYFEQCGNPQGKPVVMLHGGPGGGCNTKMRRFHDPAKYRIVLFDQRGAGRSTPHADLTDNTTWDLVADIERLRAHLGIERWQVFGGSWGSTLALTYAQTHSQQVTELVLRGIFLLRRWELEWFYQEGASRLFPDAWEHYIAAIPAEEWHDLISAFHRRLTSTDEATRLAAAKAWSVWEGATSFLHVDEDFVTGHEDAHFALAFARIENHYFVNGGFFDAEDKLLRDAHRIAEIPGVIVQGRYDVVCPMQSAWELHKAWPKAELKISPAAGHSAFEPETVDALVRATDSFA
ncbi:MULTISPECIES: prolyl aminopeptidase [Xanthomonas]|uniref:prolyl aminopeptidase n=1 Tax=Xanthomonas TaxID=338 RepID=UPI00096E912A|nr:prolyl aminopeptidase [Xanthomonas campestris]MCC5094395.1 prolyl aminopeptidase [Xanthomonas campestris pv. incanae]MEA9609565.1 prolyl aminopeptidase [Xanthomonas campestris pv. incanae]MEA9621492.1 prolyl aminopeptidase [Xanthomonas campestris pv. incanae]RFF46402.1 prolyl aminopeptidase [Xanthomonas campestris pv. incanae]WDJ10817.1 prolyl aminopeptidase [Xanthomonas campestris pv. incanae]